MYFEQQNLNVHRSRKGTCIYIVEFELNEDGASVAKVRVNRDQEQYGGFDDSYELEMLTFLVGNLLLGGNSPFPIPDIQMETSTGLFQHRAAGPGYTEVTVSSPKATKFW